MGQPQWVAQGPAPAIFPGPGYPDASGRILRLAADPANPSRLFATAENGGVWRTENAGAASPFWVPLTDSFPCKSMYAVSFNPLDPGNNTLFAGALDRILLTTDGGATWVQLGTGAFSAATVLRVLPSRLTSPKGQLVLAATTTGLYRSEDTGQTWDRRSGANGQSSNGLPEGRFSDVVEDPGTPGRFIAVTVHPPQLFRSIDQGVSWTDIGTAIGFPTTYSATRLSVSPSADASGSHWVYLLCEGLGVFCSKNFGDLWQAMDPAPNKSGFNRLLVASPGQPNVVYVGSDSPAHWRGDVNQPKGSQWVQLDPGNTGGTAPHTDAHDWVFSADANVMYESDDGGVYRLTNPVSKTPRWASANGNLCVAEFYQVAYDSLFHIVVGASQDNGILQQTTPNAVAWALNEDQSSDGTQVGIDNTSSLSESIHYTCVKYLQNLQRLTHTSATNIVKVEGCVGLVNGTKGKSYRDIELGLGQPAGTINFGSRFAVNSVDGRRLLLATDYLYESQDRGDTVESLGGVGKNAMKALIPLKPVGTVVCMAYGHPSDADVLYVGTNANNKAKALLWARAKGGGYPTPVDSYSKAGGGTPTGVAVNPNDSRNAFVVDQAGKVWRTTDGGDTLPGWSDITANLPSFATDLRSILVLGGPSNLQVVVGGYGGVFISDDPAATPGLRWSQLGESLPYTIVSDMQYDAGDQILLAGTYGRGAWTLPFGSGSGVTDRPQDPACAAMLQQIYDQEAKVDSLLAQQKRWYGGGHIPGSFWGAGELVKDRAILEELRKSYVIPCGPLPGAGGPKTLHHVPPPGD